MVKNMQDLILTLYFTLSIVNFFYCLYYLTIPYFDDFDFIDKCFTILFMIVFSFIFGPFIVFNWSNKEWIKNTINKFENAYYGDE